MTEKHDNQRARVLSGMRPTGKLHLGNYVGALQNWVKLQHTYDCFFFVADWHALTTDYDDTARLASNTLEVVLDFLAAGLDPEKCTIFVQSQVLEHAELHILFSMITPLGWLERVPSFKEQQQNLPNKDLHMYGFLGYPLLQAADILIYRADYVPVGEDQVAHVELTREVARRFNNFYNLEGKPVFPEPEALLTPTPKLLGTDKRKMSKSYGNTILLSDDAAAVEEKIKNSVTDRPKLSDKGSPDRCPVGNLHQIFSDKERLAYITDGCTNATITCVECKALAVESVEAHLKPIRERRKRLEAEPDRLRKILMEGDEKARTVAEQTMRLARQAIGIFSLEDVKKDVRPSVTEDRMRVPQSAGAAKDRQERQEILTGAWIDHISKSHPLRKDRPGIFITRKGRKVGVNTALEDQSGDWHFILPDRPLNVIVLLAETADGFVQDYVLPPKLVQEFWKTLERANGTVHITAGKTGDGVSLQIANAAVPIQRYRGNYGALE